MAEAVHRLHGLDLSYFTGKTEAYLRAKGVAFESVETDTRGFERCARLTGVRQMPQLELADGSWLTDSSEIVEWFETRGAGPALKPALRPVDPAAAFVSLLIEDFGDEALWRPALYWRWAFAADARLMSERLARGMLRDVPGPVFLRRLVILNRQRLHYLSGDGVTAANRAAVEGLYPRALDALQPVFAKRAFVLGERPTEADFGLFGSMFRHFASDPTPARLMRERAPDVLAWTGRVWSLTPERVAAAPEVRTVPDDLGPLFDLVERVHLPELEAHAEAVAAGRRRARFALDGAPFDVPAAPYRAWALGRLRARFRALAADARRTVEGLIGPRSAAILARETAPAPRPIPELPIRPGQRPGERPGARPLDRLWRGGAV